MASTNYRRTTVYMYREEIKLGSSKPPKKRSTQTHGRTVAPSPRVSRYLYVQLVKTLLECE